MELNFNIYDYVNKPVVYVAYVGDGVIKVGYSTDILDREKRHLCSQTYKQFRYMYACEVTSKKLEKELHNVLERFRYMLAKEHEIYKYTGTFTDFVGIVDKWLWENDKDMRLKEKDDEIMRLKEENMRLKEEKGNLTLL